MYRQNPLAFANENVNTKVFFFFVRESMGSFGMRKDTKGGLNVASLGGFSRALTFIKDRGVIVH